MAGLLVASADIAAPTVAQAQSDPLDECLGQCLVSANMITDASWRTQYLQMCNANCIEEYDGGTNSQPTTGTNPIGGCSYGSCYYDPKPN